MPEYLAPGVFIEEVSFRSKSIEGVSTTTTGFVGPTRYGPVELEPDVITSLGEFERIYGDRQQLNFQKSGDPQKIDNYMWHAVRAFFEEGGKRLYISRTFNPISDEDDGHAKAFILGKSSAPATPAKTWIKQSARFPGELGKMRVWLTLRLGQSVLGKAEIEENGTKKTISTVGNLHDRDVVLIENVPKKTLPPPVTSPPTPIPPVQPTDQTFYIAQKKRKPDTGEIFWEFVSGGNAPKTLKLEDLDVEDGDRIRVVTLTVVTRAVEDPEAETHVYSDLALDPEHERAGTPDSIFEKFKAEPANQSDARRLPIIIDQNKLQTGLDVLQLLFDELPEKGKEIGLENKLKSDESSDEDRSISKLLADGNDGERPDAEQYEGTANDTDSFKTGLKAFEDIEDISIVAAPGATFDYADPEYKKQASTIINLLISHAERMRYRIAVLDSGDDQAIAEVREMRARIDSKYAAFYYPWVKVLDPVTQKEINLPPSGFVSGIYARNDVERAVYKAPANEVVRLAIGFEKTLNKAQQEVLNPEGINCFRYFEGRGYRLWGARTTSSDPEWKYVNLRRYFAYIERSVDRGTQWAVFEPNGEALWANVRQTIQDFLYNEWVSGALLGEKPEKAYFVKCDRSTMTQNDLDNGRLVCLVGMAVVKPAEFVIFRIGQWTADRKV
ncbi:MAG: phage tail sheath subtilisin-like domain-containing protein [Pyrinomonadaceae bacterium]